MRNLKSLTVKISACLIVLFASNFANASFMKSWMKPFSGPGQSINLLIVTGNYSKSRMLAELIQSYNSQPILLIPAAGTNTPNDIFFIPPKKDGKALKITVPEMTNFINFVNPKMVLILGGQDYVPDSYYDMIQDNRTIIRLKGKDWDKTADSAGKLLNLTNLARDYRRLLNDLQSDTVYQRAPAPSKPAAPAVTEVQEIQVFAIEAAPDTGIIDASTK